MIITVHDAFGTDTDDHGESFNMEVIGHSHGRQ